MAGTKVIFIIPGFKQSPKNRAYKDLARLLESEGFLTVLVGFPWEKTTISENSNNFLKVFKKIKADKKYILGFSFGAMVAFLASTKTRVDGLILCSLSPYFSEDLPESLKNLKPSARAHYKDFKGLSYKSVASKTRAKQILFLYGENEAKSLVKRVLETFDALKSEKKHLIKVKKTEHEIGAKKYIATIHSATQILV